MPSDRAVLEAADDLGEGVVFGVLEADVVASRRKAKDEQQSRARRRSVRGSLRRARHTDRHASAQRRHERAVHDRQRPGLQAHRRAARRHASVLRLSARPSMRGQETAAATPTTLIDD